MGGVAPDKLPHQAQALSRAAGITITDPRFATQPYFDTAEHAQEWEDRLWEAMAAKPYSTGRRSSGRSGHRLRLAGERGGTRPPADPAQR